LDTNGPCAKAPSSAAVPFFQPHQLIVIAVRCVGRVELGSERLVPTQPFRCRIRKGTVRTIEELALLHVLVRSHTFAEAATIADERPIFEDLRLAAHA